MSPSTPPPLLPGAITFYRAPAVSDPSAMRGAVAVVGVPHDLGVGSRPGARLGPRAVREASMRLGPLDAGVFDVETGRLRLTGRRVVDAGDVAALRSQPEASLDAVEAAVAALAEAGALPVLIGGDHSLTGAAVRGLAGGAPFGVLQIDAHLDLEDRVAGSRATSSSPMRRAAEVASVERIVQVGIRGPRTSGDAYAFARERGHLVVTRDAFRRADARAEVLAALDGMERCYVTLDMDAFDPAIAPGVSAPEPDGFDYRTVKELLAQAAARTELVALDVVEVNPLVDVQGATSNLAAVAVLDLLAALIP